MAEVDFYTGEDWTFRGPAVDVDGNRVSMIGAALTARFSTSQGVILDLTQNDSEVTVVTDQSGSWDYEILVPPSRQNAFTSRFGRYQLEVRVTTTDGRVALEASRAFRVRESSFTRFM